MNYFCRIISLYKTLDKRKLLHIYYVEKLFYILSDRQFYKSGRKNGSIGSLLWAFYHQSFKRAIYRKTLLNFWIFARKKETNQRHLNDVICISTSIPSLCLVSKICSRTHLLEVQVTRVGTKCRTRRKITKRGILSTSLWSL